MPIWWWPATPSCSRPRPQRSGLARCRIEPYDASRAARAASRRASSKSCTCRRARAGDRRASGRRAMPPMSSHMLDRACDGCMNGEFAAMVTAPVQKSTLMDAGYRFTGHTEYLAARTRAALPVMLLVSERLRVALVTTHLAAGRCAARHHPRSAARHRCASCNLGFGAAFLVGRPANRGARPQSARRRGRPLGPRRNRRDRARDPRSCAPKGWTFKGPCRRTPRLRRASCKRPM